MDSAHLDGIVNLANFNRLTANFGLSASGPAGPTPEDWARLAAAVPEPNLVPLSLCALRGFLRRRRGRARA